jgi:hypothetical protein
VTEEERRELLDDEWLIVRNSGEIPEITYHSSLYYLGQDPDGPDLTLTEIEKQFLKDAAFERYSEIILRDIQLENFHKTIYRGVRRTIYNWHRCLAFGERQGIDCGSFRETLVAALILFLEEGSRAAGGSLPEQFLNCSFDELGDFFKDLGVPFEKVSVDLESFCLLEEGLDL